MKLFDRPQKILMMGGIASLAVSLVFQVIMTALSTPIYDENNLSIGYEYPEVIQSLFGLFTYLHIFFIAWFIIRIITYKMRLKESGDINIPIEN